MRTIPIFSALNIILCGSTSAFLATPSICLSHAPQSFRSEAIVGSAQHQSVNYKQYINLQTTKSNDEDTGIATNNIIGRRQLLHGVILSAAFKSMAACAYASASLVPTIPTDISTGNKAAKPAICDPTVESYQKGSNQIHIVGTAHISSVSAQLSREVVKEAEPDAVFIELDLQRLSRAFRNGKINRPITILFFTGENTDGGGKVALASAVLAPQNLQKESRGLAHLLEKMALKNPIEEEITPGEEFITAVEEGVSQDSLIILGDRRMDITLRRIVNALVFHTDPKKLVEADRIITSKLKDRMPELTQWEEEFKLQKRELSTSDLALFVERMKTKEAITDIMREIQIAAPELHQALVGERDLYMARGMNIVFSSSLSSVMPPPSLSTSSSSLKTMVAVMGLGHMSGVGNELQLLGWRRFVPNQC